MNTPWGDDGVDDSGEPRCPHGELDAEECALCDDEAPFDPDAQVKFERENPREDP